MGLIPSLAIGATAYVAGELVLKNNDKIVIKEDRKVLDETLNKARNTNTKINEMIPKIESEELRKDIKEIYETINKIINAVEKKPVKYKMMRNFFDYYLPVTINILTRYDEIENQKLTSEDSKKFMNSAEKMISKINDAFKKQLSNLYQSDMIDADAEMKVFETMLQSDGYYENEDFKG